MRSLPLLAALALTGCPSRPSPSPAASTAASTPSAPADLPSRPTTPTASASQAPSAPTLTILAPTPPNPAPIRDCDPLGATGDDPDCLTTLERTTKNRTVAECKKIDALPGYSAAPTAFARGFHTTIEGCFRSAMVRELDRRLVPLKSVDATEFHREMILQKTFNDALRATCDEIMDHEQSTGDFRGEFRCSTFLTELRARQAESINAGGLTTTHAPAVGAKRARHFKAFATQLCALIDLWKGPPPESCDARILGEIEDTLAGAARF
jgi:hypothetical protein